MRQLLTEVHQLDNLIENLCHQTNINAFELETIRKAFEEDKNRILAEAAALKPLARLEDTSIFKVKKPIRKNKFKFYWFAAWIANGKRRNIYLGSCEKMNADIALQKARKLKIEALGLRLTD